MLRFVLIFSQNVYAALISGVLFAILGMAPTFSAESFNFEQVFLPLIATSEILQIFVLLVTQKDLFFCRI